MEEKTQTNQTGVMAAPGVTMTPIIALAVTAGLTLMGSAKQVTVFPPGYVQGENTENLSAMVTLTTKGETVEDQIDEIWKTMFKETGDKHVALILNTIKEKSGLWTPGWGVASIKRTLSELGEVATKLIPWEKITFKGDFDGLTGEQVSELIEETIQKLTLQQLVSGVNPLVGKIVDGYMNLLTSDMTTFTPGKKSWAVVLVDTPVDQLAKLVSLIQSNSNLCKNNKETFVLVKNGDAYRFIFVPAYAGKKYMEKGVPVMSETMKGVKTVMEELIATNQKVSFETENTFLCFKGETEEIAAFVAEALTRYTGVGVTTATSKTEVPEEQEVLV